ncbi:MAG TPA: hypothetical protein VD931_19645 [Baekduia sp.]|nr:hypothetical protein [Baekduia sp.]
MEGDVRVLVAVAHGPEGHVAAVVRDEDGELLLTGSTSFGGGTLLDAEHDIAVEEHDDHVVAGGLLPEGAVAVDVRDGRGQPHAVTCDAGAWVCVLPSSAFCAPPSVVFRDRAGNIVPRRRR